MRKAHGKEANMAKAKNLRYVSAKPETFRHIASGDPAQYPLESFPASGRIVNLNPSTFADVR